MASRHRGSTKEARALDTFVKLTRASDTLGARLTPQVQAHGLTLAQLAVLEALYHVGPMLSCEVGRKILRSNANVTSVVDNLERSGLVARERGEADRRTVTLSLTAAGRRKIEEVFPEHAARITELLSALSTQEVEELGRLCKKLGLSAAAG